MEGRAPQQCTFRIQSIDGSLVSHETLCKEADRHFAVISIACGEAFDDGALDESSLHWACTPRQGGPWEGPPPGWTSDASNSQDAGESFSKIVVDQEDLPALLMCWMDLRVHLKVCMLESLHVKHVVTLGYSSNSRKYVSSIFQHHMHTHCYMSHPQC